MKMMIYIAEALVIPAAGFAIHWTAALAVSGCLIWDLIWDGLQYRRRLKRKSMSRWYDYESD